MSDETGRATSARAGAVESNNHGGRGARTGRWRAVGVARPNRHAKGKRARDPRCESRTFPRRGPHVSDRRLRSLRSGAPGGPRGSAVRSPPRLSVWLGGAHVRPPTAASSVPSGRKGAGTGGAPDGDPRDECRAGPSLTPRSRTAAGHYFCRRSCFSNFFLSFPACSFFFGSAGGRTTWATSGPCHVIAATRALPCHIGGTG